MKTWVDLIRYMCDSEIREKQSEEPNIYLIFTRTFWGWAFVKIRYKVGNNDFRTLTINKNESLEKFYRENKNAELIIMNYNSNEKRVKFPDELEYEMFKAS